MDFIERIFGVSPDGGSGSLEVLLLVLVAAIVTFAVIMRIERDDATDNELGANGPATFDGIEARP